MKMIRVQEKDNNANGYLVYLFQVVSRLKLLFKKNSQVVSRWTYKWYPTSGTHEVSKCSRNGSYWQIQQVVPWYQILSSDITFLHVVSIIQDGGSTSDHQL